MNAIEVLMQRDDLTEEEAIEIVKDAVEAALEELLHDGDPEEVWMQETGLEPDYLMEYLL
jgi:20S proteasome alpha/beta subunit